MKNKLISDFKNSYKKEKHPKIKGIQIIEDKNNFPISWLNQQGYCEYSLYLEYFEGIETKPTQAMATGTVEHQRLEDKFKEDAVPTTFNEILEISREEIAISREMFVISPKYGIRGFIDEIWMTPDEFVVIDDKPGKIAYPSTINQILAYCLAFKSMITTKEYSEKRKIKAALRERGTENIFWMEEFDENNQKKIESLINRMHGLFEGSKSFIPTKNPNKCNKCRFQSYCEHFQLLIV